MKYSENRKKNYAIGVIVVEMRKQDRKRFGPITARDKIFTLQLIADAT